MGKTKKGTIFSLKTLYSPIIFYIHLLYTNIGQAMSKINKEKLNKIY